MIFGRRMLRGGGAEFPRQSLYLLINRLGHEYQMDAQVSELTRVKIKTKIKTKTKQDKTQTANEEMI